MGFFKSLSDALFGKDPNIFDDNGNVIHKHPKRLWEAWSNRIKNDTDYNWRNHTGTRAGRRTQDLPKNSNKP